MSEIDQRTVQFPYSGSAYSSKVKALAAVKYNFLQVEERRDEPLYDLAFS